ncbi:MAG: hypothetical protein HOH20_09690 [Rhodospirillaceae bacterium]|jgi:hypothetical protein|nr:hypothetical protein [Rhodospirillaceae bacterium]MBT6089836.1 hypothetical protein [Rhodospirillaceae bacterium]
MFNFLKRKRPPSASEIISRVFSETLGMDSVDPNANFFELGGDSMLATIVVASLDEAGHPLPSTAVFDYPTINGLTHVIESGATPPSAGFARTIASHPRNSSGSTRMSASVLQERLWPYERNPDPKRFQPRGEGAILLTGSLNVKALEVSISLITERHEVLRSSFSEEANALHVDIHTGQPVRLEIRHASGDTPELRRADAAEIVAKATSGTFDLRLGPPSNVALIKLSETEHVLAISMHHIISDGWSMGLLVNEIAIAYEALNEDANPGLPDLPYQFADYAAWHREWLTSDAGCTSVDFWRSYLKGGTPALEVKLPSDKPRQTTFNFPVRRSAITLDNKVQQDIRSLAKSAQTSVHTVFFAGFLFAFRRLTDCAELPVGIMHANRNTPGTQNLIGFFSTLILLRFEFDGKDDSIVRLIELVRDTTREVEPHSSVPIGTLLDEGIVDTLPRVFVDSVPRPSMPSINGLVLEDFPFDHPPLFAVADIALFLFDNGKELSCLLGTNEDMFSDKAASDLADAIAGSLSNLDPQTDPVD